MNALQNLIYAFILGSLVFLKIFIILLLMALEYTAWFWQLALLQAAKTVDKFSSWHPHCFWHFSPTCICLDLGRQICIFKHIIFIIKIYKG
jgi:hypothetical protein